MQLVPLVLSILSRSPNTCCHENQVKQYDVEINQGIIIHCQVNHISYVLALSSVCSLVNKRFNQGLPHLLLKVVLWITLPQTIVHHIHSKNITVITFISNSFVDIGNYKKGVGITSSAVLTHGHSGQLPGGIGSPY